MAARTKTGLASGLALAAGLCLYFLPPWQYRFYPRCLFFQLTGWQCPGCGMTRALASLLHGQLSASWHYNPLVLLSLPLLAAYLFVAYWSFVRRGRRLWPRLPQAAVPAILVTLVLFGVGRNLHFLVR